VMSSPSSAAVCKIEWLLKTDRTTITNDFLRANGRFQTDETKEDPHEVDNIKQTDATQKLFSLVES
jgi:hypothetical protein